MARTRILLLVGSAVDQFHLDLSCLYAQGCLEAIRQIPDYDVLIAYINPNRVWQFPVDLSPAAIAAAAYMSLSEAVQEIIQAQITVVLPQMFCLPGMTDYRSLFDLLQIPYLGNSAAVMALTADKGKARAIVAAAGVQVPPGELLSRLEFEQGQRPQLLPPAVVKPVTADNSFGLALVQHPSEYPAALEAAFTYASTVLIETYIELGREVRCGLWVKDGELLSFPLEEYAMDARSQPIRTHMQKLRRSDQGDLSYASKDKSKAWIVEPTDPITPSVWQAARRCHQALGCRHYSLFDFRIDPQGQPWFLEAGLYCSFAPQSVIVMMAEAAGLPLKQLLENLMAEAIRS